MADKSFGAYKRVFMLGIDGMGAFNRLADTPCMDALLENGATTYTALASKPTISAQCWTSMLTGAAPEIHGLTNSDMHPIKELPTLFRILREKHPEAELAAFTDWSPIVKDLLAPEGCLSACDTGKDDGLTDRLLAYLDGNDPMFLFIQFDSVDGAGHRNGYGSQGHIERIAHVDGLLGKLIDKYKEKGIFDDTLFIVTADHGGTPGENGQGGGHGGWTDGEKLVFLGVAGKNIKHGEIGEACMRDFPAIVLHALGIKAPEFNKNGYAAQLPINIFDDAGVRERVEVIRETDVEVVHRAQPDKSGSDYIGNFINEEKIALWLDFENGIEDACGKCTLKTQRGIVKTYENGVVGKSGEFGNAVVRVDGLKTEDVFCFSLWFTISTDGRWLDLFSNKKDSEKSFTLTLSDDTLLIITKDDGNRRLSVFERAHPSEKLRSGSWMHFLFRVDTVNNEFDCWINFEKTKGLKTDFDIKPHFDMSRLFLAPDSNENAPFYKVVDDVMVINGDVDPQALRRYYKL